MFLNSIVMSLAMFVMQSTIAVPEFTALDGYYNDTVTCEEYSDGFEVSFKKTDSDTDIYYRIDGVTNGYHKYKEPFVIFEDADISAYAKSDEGKSEIVERSFHLRRQIGSTRSSGIYDEPFNVKLIHANCTCVQDKHTVIYYEIDGSTPDEKSPKYNPKKGIDIDETCKLSIKIVPDNDAKATYQHFYYIVTDESNLFNYKSKFYYNTLSDKQKQAYSTVYKAVESGKQKFSIAEHKLSLDETFETLEAFMNENPQFFFDYYKFNYNKYAKTVTLFGYENHEEQQKLIKTALFELYSEVLKRDISGEYDIVKAFHDVLVNMLIYDKSAVDRFNAAGAIIDHRAVCQGYAMAFTYLCQLAGLDCVTVSGDVSEGQHAWNMVKVNGKWQYVDVCWDDSEYYDYDYFLIDIKQLSKTHTLNMLVQTPG